MTRLLRLPFSEIVRERMLARGLGLRELCRTVGMDASYFSKVLALKRSPPSQEEVLERIADALGVDKTLLVVSAGRIPSAWGGLCTDESLFRRVHALLTGRSVVSAPVSSGASAQSASTPPTKRGWGRPRQTPYVPKDLEEELL
jgi:transcriptional regulator with XRE-family HTH domain